MMGMGSAVTYKDDARPRVRRRLGATDLRHGLRITGRTGRPRRAVACVSDRRQRREPDPDRPGWSGRRRGQPPEPWRSPRPPGRSAVRAAAVTGQLPYGRRRPAAAADHLVWAILLTLFCCLPLASCHRLRGAGQRRSPPGRRSAHSSRRARPRRSPPGRPPRASSSRVDLPRRSRRAATAAVASGCAHGFAPQRAAARPAVRRWAPLLHGAPRLARGHAAARAASTPTTARGHYPTCPLLSR